VWLSWSPSRRVRSREPTPGERRQPPGVVVEGGVVVDVDVVDVVVDVLGVDDVVVVDVVADGLGPLPGLSVVVVVVVDDVVVLGSTAPRSTVGWSPIASMVSGSRPGTRVIDPGAASCEERNADELHGGMPGGLLLLLFTVSWNDGDEFQFAGPTLTMAVPYQHCTTGPFVPGHVTRTPTDTVSCPPMSGHRTLGLLTDASFDVIQPMLPVPLPRLGDLPGIST